MNRPDNFREFLGGLLCTSGTPTVEEAEAYQVVINVSDQPGLELDPLPGRQYFWLPISEWGEWGYATFYALKKILDRVIVAEQKKTLVHCAVGAHRSVLAVHLWLQSVGEAGLGRGHEAQLRQDIRYGRIPSRLPEFFRRMDAQPSESAIAILAEMRVPEMFSRKTKWMNRRERLVAFLSNPYRYFYPKSFTIGELMAEAQARREKEAARG